MTKEEATLKNEQEKLKRKIAKENREAAMRRILARIKLNAERAGPR